MINWHSLNLEEIARILRTDFEKGLALKEVKDRQEKFGKNLLPEEELPSSWRMFLEQFKSPLVYILIMAGLVSLILKEWTDAIVIFIAVFINGLCGFWEEKKTSKILEKLKKFLRPKAIVLRENQKKEILAENLVPGDIIFLKAGDRVPADGRLLECQNLRIDESILTGEWVPSQKITNTLPKETPLAERDNMVYSGCLVESGEGKAVVVAIGSKTEIGKIATLIKKTKEEKSPLQKKLSGFSRLVGVAIVMVCIFIFLGGILRGGNILKLFETSVAIAVGGIPEGLPVVMTVILAIGMERILRKKGLIRKLTSVETLGSARVICFDKTKTLTEGKMELAEILATDKKLAFKIAALCNEAFIEKPQNPPQDWKIIGTPTDRALIISALKYQILKPELEKKSEELAKLPFDPTLKFQLSLRKEGEKILLFISGAPERILERAKNKEGWSEKIEGLAKKGLRVIGVGYKEISDLKSEISNLGKEELERMAEDFTLVGLMGLKDPIRKEVPEAIRVAKEAGLVPVIVTGDHKITAKAVAREIGLEVKEDEILEGRELDQLSREELKNKISQIKIFARAEPLHKIKIIQAWQSQGEVVAMTGDGVNDAPALKRADVGVALGSGTEVAKFASDLILLDDSFSTLVKAIEEGRRILDNLRKGITYVMANSFASAVIVGLATLFGWPLPILAVQILWNNIVEDSLPNLAYAFEPGEKEIMKRKPPSPKVPLLTKEMKILIFATGTIYQSFGLLLFGILWKILGMSLDYCRTMVFGVLVLNTAFVIFGYKNLRKNIFHYNPFSNQVLNLSALIIVAFFALSIYLPHLQKLLHTVALGWGSWLILVGISLASLALIELTKWYFISRRLIQE